MGGGQVKALTIRQPWAWAICHAGKRIENRAWLKAPSLLAVARRLVGQRIAIHAAAGGGKRDDFDDAAEHVIARCRGVEVAKLPPVFQRIGARWALDAEAPRGAVVAVAMLAAVVRTLPGGHRATPARIECDMCGQAIPDDGSGPCPNADPWAIEGTVGLILADVAVLPRPVPYKGGQGWWEIPDGVACGGGR